MLHFSIPLTLLGMHALALCVEEPVSPALMSDELKSSHNPDIYPNASLFCSDEYACPPGLFCQENHCECGVYPNYAVTCYGEYSFLQKYTCATFDEKMNLTVIGGCLFINTSVAGKYSPMYNQLPRNATELNNMCNPWNRTGTLCGRCLPGHYPSAYSYNMACIQCPNARWNWAKYIMAAYLPLTFFFIIIIFCKINATSSHLFAVVYFCQAITPPQIMRLFLLGADSTPSSIYVKYLLPIAKIITSFYGIWNLDFFRLYYSDLCLGIGILPTLALDYVIAMYPLLLAIISYLLIVLHDQNYRVITMLWKPFKIILSRFNRNWYVKTSIINSFSTFFFLSTIKFLSISSDFLLPAKVYNLYHDHFNYTVQLLYSPDIEYFGKEHLPYAILAMVIMCVFVCLPFIVLSLYPFRCFQKFLNLFSCRWYILHTFVDSFQGCYTDGTESGTKDYRWFASIFLIGRCGLFIPVIMADGIISSTLDLIILVLLTTSTAILQPFKSSVSHYNVINVVFLLFMTVCFIAFTGYTSSVLFSPSSMPFMAALASACYLVPLVYATAISFYWLYTHRKVGWKLLLCRKVWRNGYAELPESLPDRIENSNAYPKKNLAKFT